VVPFDKEQKGALVILKAQSKITDFSSRKMHGKITICQIDIFSLF
jgi:hypothetical protein